MWGRGIQWYSVENLIKHLGFKKEKRNTGIEILYNSVFLYQQLLLLFIHKTVIFFLVSAKFIAIF